MPCMASLNTLIMDKEDLQRKMFEINVNYTIIPCKMILKASLDLIPRLYQPKSPSMKPKPTRRRQSATLLLQIRVKQAPCHCTNLRGVAMRYCHALNMADIQTAFLNHYFSFSLFTRDNDSGRSA